MKLYYHPASTTSRPLMLFAAENGIKMDMQVVDLAYLPDGRDTALVAAAKEAGCDIVVDGLDVLLFQGAAAFERWTGLAAPLLAMRDALRNEPPG